MNKLEVNSLYNRVQACRKYECNKYECNKCECNKEIHMQNSYRYFKNEQCKYFPCHKIEEGQDFNCLFCYCPLNQYEDCPGNPRIIERESGKKIKDCTNCTFPHMPENYDYIVHFLSNKMK